MASRGKNRKPRDHNRDYDRTSIHKETAAIRALVPKWSDGKLAVTIDLHCPTIRGTINETLYQVGREDERLWGEQQRFGQLLERHARGPIPYKVANNVPFGTSWNTAANYTAGMSSSRWAAGLPGVRVATTFEIPYANASGKAVTAESAQALGRDLATTIAAYLQAKP